LQKQAASKAPPKKESKHLTLPARLIISAEKPLLDEVGSKITVSDFKNLAKVQHLPFQD
jgi:hypothetical protein